MLALIFLSLLVPAASLRNSQGNSHGIHGGAVMGSELCSRTQALLEKRKGSSSNMLMASTLERACKRKSRDDDEPEPSYACEEYLRFSCLGKTTMNLGYVSYPAMVQLLDGAVSSNAVSVRLFNQGQVEGTSWKSLLGWIYPRPRPTQPESGSFWAEFDQITQLQISRRGGDTAASKMLLPQMFQTFTMEEGAAAVFADFPSQFPTDLTLQFLAEGVDFDETIIPHATADDFVNKQVMLARIIGWAVSTVSPTCFAAKWHEGRPRPEEVAWAIVNNDTRVASAPADVVNRVRSLNLAAQGGTDYTAYGIGSPKHPAWPAMHSAASTASVFLPVVLNLTASQIIETQRVDCAVATFRSFAGVHYESDNMAGLAIGQEVIRRELPEMLHRVYGSSTAKVRAKLNKVISGGLFPGHAGNDWRLAPSCLSR